MDQAVDDIDDVFIYRGGKVPQHVKNAIIHHSVKKVEKEAFGFGGDNENEDLEMGAEIESVIFHDDVEEIDVCAFGRCTNLSSLKLPGVRRIKGFAFRVCTGLRDIEFGDNLHTIELYAFHKCTNLRSLTALSVQTIGERAFLECKSLTDAVFGEELDSLGVGAFEDCESLKRIAIPLKAGLFVADWVYDGRHPQFDGCVNLERVDLVGGVHKTVASLHHESWRNEMREVINFINRLLPNTSADEKGGQINIWMTHVTITLERLKAMHMGILHEATTLLELAIWKAKLSEKEEDYAGGRTKKARVDVDCRRKEKRITSGANTVIKNVLPFLQLG